MIDAASLQDLLGKWWFNYDEGNFDVLPTLLTDDVYFSVRTDSDAVAWAAFATAEARGRNTVMAWQVEHRRQSPYPLRHNGSNADIVEQRGDEATFASYIAVSQVVAEMPSGIPGGVVRGVVRQQPDGLRIAELHVVLDTVTSDVFASVKA